MDVPKVLSHATIWIIVLIFIVLIITSAIVRDYRYMVEKPLFFMVETIMISILPALPIFFFYVTRSTSPKQTTLTFLALVIKFAALHILFQLSGIYSYTFRFIS